MGFIIAEYEFQQIAGTTNLAFGYRFIGQRQTPLFATFQSHFGNFHQAITIQYCNCTSDGMPPMYLTNACDKHHCKLNGYL